MIRSGNNLACSVSAYVGATSLRNALQYPQVLVENISISAAYAVDIKQNHSAMVKITFFISAPFI
jgi:hypothetical protein